MKLIKLYNNNNNTLKKRSELMNGCHRISSWCSPLILVQVYLMFNDWFLSFLMI